VTHMILQTQAHWQVTVQAPGQCVPTPIMVPIGCRPALEEVLQLPWCSVQGALPLLQGTCHRVLATRVLTWMH
jgi:hypothetical protein